MLKNSTFSFLLLCMITTSSFVFTGCSNLGVNPSEAIISYDISYPIPFEDKWLERLMPKDMTMKFKDHRLKTELSFGLGMIKIGFLSDSEKRELFEMLKFMKKKNFSTRNNEEVNLMMSNIPPHKITPGESTKMIAGYTCTNSFVEVKDDTTSYDFECWHTSDLGIKDMNWSSPFSPIQGVLMEYEIERFDVKMKFTATKVELVEFEAGEFIIPEKYSEITFKEMQENLEQLKDI